MAGNIPQRHPSNRKYGGIAQILQDTDCAVRNIGKKPVTKVFFAPATHHIKGAIYQAYVWMKSRWLYGWAVENGKLLPAVTMKEPASRSLLEVTETACVSTGKLRTLHRGLLVNEDETCQNSFRLKQTNDDEDDDDKIGAFFGQFPEGV